MQVANVRDAIDAIAEERPGATFLVSPETASTVTFQELQEQSRLLSRMLRQAGLERGDKAAFLMDNGLLYTLLFAGTMYGGYVSVPLNVRAGVVQLSYMLDHCEAKIVFVEDQYTALLREALESVRRNIRVIAVNADGQMPVFETLLNELELLPLAARDVALLMYSSGSTGKPKGAIHTHSSILAHGRNSMEAHRLSSSDRSLLVLPLYHINAECVTLIPSLLSGGSVVVPHRFLVNRFWDWIDDLHVTWSALVPTIVSDLVNWDDPGKDRRADAFRRIRFLRSSSAPLSPSLHRQFLDKFKLPLLQAMGSTEGGNVFSNPVPPGTNKIGSPGLPWGFETRIVDREGADVQPGESGEVLLRGAGLMKAYYKDPEGTAAVVDSDGWLHTGDLARQDEDGYFFVVGRAKELIIKGGVNIAPRHIDEVLESHPAVLEAAAVGVPDAYFGEDAVAFVVLRPGCAADEIALLAFCESRLGHFKTPSRIHFIHELPKGPSGKVQRLRLLDPAILSAVAAKSQPDSAAVVSHAAATNASISESSIEVTIAASWEDALGVQHVDLDSNFFALGGDSLAAIRCLSKLRGTLPIILSITDFFAGGTVRGQAELVKRRLCLAADEQQAGGDAANWERSLVQQSAPRSGQVIPHLESTEAYPLSPAQQRIWFLEQLYPDIPIYNEAEAVRLTGELNVNALERAVNTIVDHYAVLRSTIKIIDEVPHAIIHRRWPLRFKTIDLRSLPAAERESEVNRLLIDEPKIHYDLQAEPGIRVTLLNSGPREHVLILMMHHTVCDWSSVGVFWRILSKLYGALIRNEPVELAPLPITHRDYAVWKRQELVNENNSKDLEFWEKTLHGVPQLLELPSDRKRPPILSYRGGRLRWKLDSALTESLRRASRQEKISVFTIFAAALNALIYRYTGIEDIPLGIPLADRDLPEEQSLIGFLLHVHVLRSCLSGEMTFRELLSRVQGGVLDLYVHRAVPFDRIVQRLQPGRSLSYNPLFQVMLNWRDRDQLLSSIGLDGLAIDSVMASAGTSKFDLLLFATDMGDEIWLELEYSVDLFDEDRIARMLGHYQMLLESVARDPDQRLDALPLLTDSERQRLLVGWNDTSADYPKATPLAQLVEEQVERTPNAIAVVAGEQRVTYRQLNARANQLARELREHGAGPDQVVGVYVDRSTDLVVALLAIVKTGAAYLPLDPLFPAERLTYMLEDSGARLLVSERTLSRDLPAFAGTTILLEDEGWHANRSDNLAIPVGSEHLAYLIYTSGSTGKPKGVQVGRGALTNLLWSMREQLQLSERDRLLAVTTISFDIAGVDMWLPLLVGAQMVVASREQAADGHALRDLLERHDITFLQATPVTWQLLFEAGWQGKPNLQAVCTGEAMPPEVAARLAPAVERVWNLYGPTETTIWSTGFRVTDGTPPIPIGRPVANTQIYILDSQRQPVPIGIAGELYIGGDGLARGYLNRPELTAEKFVPDPFRGGEARMYRTGDLARYRADGNIECLGRIDHQVKIRGFRIELGEIEETLKALPEIMQAVVIAREDTPGKKRLVAYYTTRKDGDSAGDAVSTEQLRTHLSATLPDYMVPSVFMRLDSLPLTPNGKLDRKALPPPVANAFSVRGYEAPQGDVETKLAEIFSDVLGINQIGRNDDFFDLGGHSLTAIRVISLIESEFNIELPVRVLFQAQSVSQIAAVIADRCPGAQRQSSEVWPTCIPIQSTGSKVPLFCVARPNVNALGYLLLSRRMGPDQPMYGLQRQLLEDPQLQFTEDQIRETAEDYIRAMQAVQPHGPYLLIGQCQGGYIAFEITRQLERQGERVAMLGMLDVWPEENTRYRSMFFAHQYAHSLLTWFRRRARNGTIAGTTPQQNRNGAAIALAHGAGTGNPLWRIYWPGRDFKPAVVSAPIVVFRGSKQPLYRIRDKEMGWGKRTTGPVEVVAISGDHFTMLREPNVQSLADRIKVHMERALSEGLRIDLVRQ